MENIIEYYDFKSEIMQNIFKKLGITKEPKIKYFDDYAQFTFTPKLAALDSEDIVKLQMSINAYSMKIIPCGNIESRPECLIIAKVDINN